MPDEFLELLSPTVEYIEVLVPQTDVLEVVTSADVLTLLEETTQYLEVQVPSQSIEVFETATEFLEVIGGQRGEQGLPGPRDRVLVSGVASTNLSGHRVVIIEDGNLSYADPTDITHARKAMHLTLGAIATGETAEVLALGYAEESSWNWTPDSKLFVGLNGILTEQVPLGAVWVRVIAFIRDPTSVYFDPQTVIRLA